MRPRPLRQRCARRVARRRGSAALRSSRIRRRDRPCAHRRLRRRCRRARTRDRATRPPASARAGPTHRPARRAEPSRRPGTSRPRRGSRRDTRAGRPYRRARATPAPAPSLGPSKAGPGSSSSSSPAFRMKRGTATQWCVQRPSEPLKNPFGARESKTHELNPPRSARSTRCQVPTVVARAPCSIDVCTCWPRPVISRASKARVDRDASRCRTSRG